MKWVFLVLGGLLFGCGANLQSRTATEDDTPFGGGVPPSHHPDGDPYRSYERRQEIRPFAQQQDHGNDNSK